MGASSEIPDPDKLLAARDAISQASRSWRRRTNGIQDPRGAKVEMQNSISPFGGVVVLHHGRST